MKKNNVIMWVVIGGGLVAGYYYVTHYGPSGAAFDVNGNQIAPTYWDTWFGSGLASTGATTMSPSDIAKSVAADDAFWTKLASLSTAPGVAQAVTQMRALLASGTYSSGSVTLPTTSVAAMEADLLQMAQQLVPAVSTLASPTISAGPQLHPSILNPTQPMNTLQLVTGWQPAPGSHFIPTVTDPTASVPVVQPTSGIFDSSGPMGGSRISSDPIPVMGQRTEIMGIDGIVPAPSRRTGMGMGFSSSAFSGKEWKN